MIRYFKEFKKDLKGNLIIIGSIISILTVFQIDWVQMNRIHRILWGLAGKPENLFDGMLFRTLAGLILGLILGIIYSILIKRVSSPANYLKLAVVHLPVFLFWIWPTKIYVNGAYLVNQIMIVIIPVLIYILLEIFFLIDKTRVDFKEKIKPALLVSGFFTLTLSFFIPLQIFLTNPNEFFFTPGNLIVYLIPVCFLIMFLSARFTLLAPLKNGIFYKILTVLFAVSLALWLQSNIMAWNYGLLDGSKILWNKNWVWGVIDGTVWIGLITVAVILKSGKIFRFIIQASVFFILIQLVFSTLSVFQKPSSTVQKVPSFRRFTIDENSKFIFSKNTNIIVLVLDEFQSDIFRALVNEDPAMKSVFDGFTYFRNASGTFPFTSAAIPSILTGEYYDNSVPEEKYLENSFLNHSILKTLIDNRFSVDLFPLDNSTVLFDERIVSNLKKRNEISSIVKELSYLYDVGLFRALPHYLKNTVYNNGDWSLYRMSQYLYTRNVFNKREWNNSLTLPQELIIFNNSVRFIYEMVRDSDSGTNVNVFKFYHIEGLHVPLKYDENFKIKGNNDYSRTYYIEQAKAMLKICRVFLEELKSLNIYDNSMIILLGDHGSGRTPEMYLNPSNKNSRASYNSTTFEFYKSRGVPLVLAKYFGARGDMKESSAPVSLSDIPKTISEEMKLSNAFLGESLFRIPENEKRIRYYRAYDYENPPNPNYLSQLTEYQVDGDSWLDSSWKATGKVFLPAVGR